MSEETIVRKPRHVGHKIALVCAGACVALMVPAVVAFFWLWISRGTADTWTPSMAAVVFFLGCCAGVLYATSVPQPQLPSEDDFPLEKR